MGKKGGSKHLKRLAAPRVWSIKRKGIKFAVKPMPGPHPKDFCIPLQMVLIDYLKVAENRREAKRILAERKVKVDGRVRTELKYPVGLMDVIELIPTEEYYRVLPSKKGVLILQGIGKEEANIKLCLIKDKVTNKGGHVQLNLHDGRNVLIKVKDPRNPVEDIYKTQDVLQISLPEQEVLSHIKLETGVIVLIVRGKNIGYVGKLKEIIRFMGPYENVARVELEDGTVLETALKYIFPIGYEKPVISLPEVQ